ncbi:MAG: phosphoribosylformylglycinamidine cyclo-ligase [Deltaproteobacteria bacterium]|nr:phosphoribosylformylglycinamidine cyclo-ligase [Candidatus Zymogenaceae bacterium]
MGITYKDSGVDIDKGNLFVKMIKREVESTRTKGVIGGIGGFGGFFRPNITGMKEPVFVSSTDGVGTKLVIAQMMGIHDTIGIDLVAMSVNDIIVTGALPLFFLDYIATGKIQEGALVSVVSGIAAGCREAGCALLGGETAEMPGFYPDGKYDLAGFAVGMVDRRSIIDGSAVKKGDVIVGIPSSGLHSNGYSLARKIVFDALKMKPTDTVQGLEKSIGEELLIPTRIYVPAIRALIEKITITAAAHITGGGLIDNIERLLPEDLSAVIDRRSWKVPPIFAFLERAGSVDPIEMMRTFNNGIGMAIIVRERTADQALKILRTMGEDSTVIGRIQERQKDAPAVSFIP